MRMCTVQIHERMFAVTLPWGGRERERERWREREKWQLTQRDDCLAQAKFGHCCLRSIARTHYTLTELVNGYYWARLAHTHTQFAYFRLVTGCAWVSVCACLKNDSGSGALPRFFLSTKVFAVAIHANQFFTAIERGTGRKLCVYASSAGNSDKIRTIWMSTNRIQLIWPWNFRLFFRCCLFSES